MKFTIIHLPEEVIRYLQPFLYHDDYHYLMNSSKLHFQSLKEKTIYFSLQTTYTLLFFNDETFRKVVLSKVTNGWKQIGLNFGGYEVPHFPKNLPVNRFTSLPNDRSINKLDEVCHIPCIEGAFVDDFFPDMPNVQELSLSQSYRMPSYRNLSHLTHLKLTFCDIEDISDLQNIPHLILTSCNFINDFSVLNGQKQRELIINMCPQLKVVDTFAGIRRVGLDFCQALENISPLHGVYDLFIEHCPKVSDLSGLGGHHRFEISFCNPKVVGFESLVSVPHVTFGGCELLIDLTPFQFSKSVKLYRCKGVTDLSPLKNLKKVSIEYCNNLTSLTSLEKVLDLKISCISPPDMSGLRYEKLDISVSAKEYSRPSLNPSLKELAVIGGNDVFTDYVVSLLPSLRYLKALTLRESPILKCADRLGDIPSIKLIECYKLVDISALGRNRCVEIRSCMNLQDVSSLRTVPIVTIDDCSAIQDISVLKDVPRLKVL